MAHESYYATASRLAAEQFGDYDSLLLTGVETDLRPGLQLRDKDGVVEVTPCVVEDVRLNATVRLKPQLDQIRVNISFGPPE